MANTTTGLGLERKRRQKGITLQQIADSTKISLSFLKAIENEEWEKLPGGVFNTNYLRQYAAATGIDSSSLMGKYELYRAAREREEQSDAPVRHRNPAVRWLASLVISIS